MRLFGIGRLYAESTSDAVSSRSPDSFDTATIPESNADHTVPPTLARANRQIEEGATVDMASIEVTRPAQHFVVTDKRTEWLLRHVARWILTGLPATAFSLGGVMMPPADDTDLVAPARWWRTEAARGIALVEAELAD